MGMFDYFRSSYDLGPELTNVECQTKDIEDGIGGTMTPYWLDPAGQLWYPTYVGTHIFETIKQDDPRYDPERGFLNYEWIPTGAHGKYQPCMITKYVEVYTSAWGGAWEDWPRAIIHFKHGKVMDYELFTRKTKSV
jgi:hypothetical protein